MCAIFSQVKLLFEAFQLDVISKPVNSIELAFAISDSMYVGFWVDGFWRKSTQLRSLIIETSNSKLLGKLKPCTLYLINLSFSVLPLIFLIFLQVHKPERPDSGVNDMKPCDSNSSLEVNADKMIHAADTWSILITIIRLPQLYIFQCLDIILLLTSVTSLKTASYLLTEARKVRKRDGENFLCQASEDQYKKEYVVISKRFQAYFTKLNEFCSGFYIAWFCMIVPWFSFRPLHALALQSFSLTLIHNWTLMVLHIVIWGCCSEAKRMVSTTMLMLQSM